MTEFQCFTNFCWIYYKTWYPEWITNRKQLEISIFRFPSDITQRSTFSARTCWTAKDSSQIRFQNSFKTHQARLDFYHKIVFKSRLIRKSIKPSEPFGIQTIGLLEGYFCKSTWFLRNKLNASANLLRFFNV